MKKLPRLLLIIFILLCITLIALVFLLCSNKQYFGLNRTKNSSPTSPNILYLTDPVKSFTGTVEQVDGNQILVSAQMNDETASPASKQVSYKVQIAPETKITRNNSPIPFLFQNPPDEEENDNSNIENDLSIKNIKTGHNITIYTETDLRTQLLNEFIATMIVLPERKTMLSGQILNISGDTIQLLAKQQLGADDTPDAKIIEKEYTVLVNENTEISYFNNDDPPEKVQSSLEELVENQYIIVYTEEDINSTTKVNALRIQPSSYIDTSSQDVPFTGE